MTRTTPKKRRRFKRRTIRTLVDYWGEAGVGSEYATTLGAGGVFVETATPAEAGSEITVRFRLPDGSSIHTVTGRVAWIHRPSAGSGQAPGMAVEFTDSAASSRLAHELDSLPEDVA